MVIWVKIVQNEFTVEIDSKSLVRAIGKVLLIKFRLNTNENHKGDEKWPLFVNQQLFWWAALITLAVTMMFYQSISHFSHFQLYQLPRLA